MDVFCEKTRLIDCEAGCVKTQWQAEEKQENDCGKRLLYSTTNQGGCNGPK